MLERRSLNVFNCIFFSAATSLALAMAAPTWRYGFFLTPFPALLSGLFLLYLGCLVVSLVDTYKPLAWLGLPMRKGSGVRGLVRMSALLLPIPMLAYFSMMLFVENNFDCCRAHLAWAQRMVDVDGFLFGHKRAEGWRSHFAAKTNELGRADLAELYLIANLQSVSSHTTDRNRITGPLIKLAQLHMEMGRAEQAKYELTHQINAYFESNEPMNRLDKINLANLRTSLAVAYDIYGDEATADELYMQAEDCMNDPTLFRHKHRHWHHNCGHDRCSKPTKRIALGHVWEVLAAMPDCVLEQQASWMVKYRDSMISNRWYSFPRRASDAQDASNMYPSLCAKFMTVDEDDYAFFQRESQNLRGGEMLNSQTLSADENASSKFVIVDDAYVIR